MRSRRSTIKIQLCPPTWAQLEALKDIHDQPIQLYPPGNDHISLGKGKSSTQNLNKILFFGGDMLVFVEGNHKINSSKPCYHVFFWSYSIGVPDSISFFMGHKAETHLDPPTNGPFGKVQNHRKTNPFERKNCKLYHLCIFMV